MREEIVWVYTSYEVRGRFVPCWELVDRTKEGNYTAVLRDYYTGITVFPDGRLLIGNRPPTIDCDSVEAAKEFGMTTYRLTKEGG